MVEFKLWCPSLRYTNKTYAKDYKQATQNFVYLCKLDKIPFFHFMYAYYDNLHLIVLLDLEKDERNYDYVLDSYKNFESEKRF